MWSRIVCAMVFGLAVVAAGVNGRGLVAADEKKPAFKPEDVRVGAPPELATLRKAVEAAAKKGENVDEIRKQLAELEKALTGKAWVKPEPLVEEPLPPPAAAPFNPNILPNGRGFRRIPQPAAPERKGREEDVEAVRKAHEALARAIEEFQKNPKDREANDRALAEYRRAIMGLMVAPGAFDGGMPMIRPALARPVDARFGVRAEKIPDVVIDQFDLPRGNGLVVLEVVPGSSAETAGIKANDILLTFAGKPVPDTTAEFIQLLAEIKANEKVDVTILRKGKKEVIKGVELPVRRRAELVPVNPVVPQGGAGSRMSVSVTNGKYTIDAQNNGVKYLIEGKTDNTGTLKIQVTDGDKKIEAESVDKLPAEYRKPVEELLSRIRFGGGGAAVQPPRKVD